MEQNPTTEAHPTPPQTTAIAEYSETAAALAELREKYARAYDVTKPAEMALAREARADLRSKRTALEKRRKEVKAPLLERGELIDSEAKRITDEIVALEDPIDAAIKAEEKRREEAKAALARAAEMRTQTARAVASEIRGVLVALVGATSPEILHALDAVKLTDYAQRVPQEEGETHQADVEAARQETVLQLQRMYEATLAQEQVRAQIDADRARLEAEQKAAAERQAADDARRAKETADAQAKIDADRKRIDAEQQAARERIAAEERAADQRRKEADAKAAAERERQQKEADAARAKEDQRIAADRAKLDAEKQATEAKARKEREAAEAKALAEQQATEEKKRAKERDELRRMDGYALLRSFVERFGTDAEFADIAATIAAWANTKEATPATKKGARQ